MDWNGRCRRIFGLFKRARNRFIDSHEKTLPLPSNTINDIDVNPTTGEVFFATSAGLVSYKGTSTKGNDDLSNVYVYPNPVRPEFYGTVKISGLINKANVKITDIEGNLVYEATSEGGDFRMGYHGFWKIPCSFRRLHGFHCRLKTALKPK